MQALFGDFLDRLVGIGDYHLYSHIIKGGPCNLWCYRLAVRRGALTLAAFCVGRLERRDLLVDAVARVDRVESWLRLGGVPTRGILTDLWGMPAFCRAMACSYQSIDF